MAAQPPYDHAGPIYSSERRSKWITTRARERFGGNFLGLLGSTGIGRGAGSLKPELYWELLDVDDQGVVTLGASYSRGGRSRNLPSRGCALLRQRRLLCCSHIIPAMAGHRGRERFYTCLARRHDFGCLVRFLTRGGTARLGVTDDEKHYQSCHSVSAGQQWKSVNE